MGETEIDLKLRNTMGRIELEHNPVRSSKIPYNRIHLFHEKDISNQPEIGQRL